MIFLTRDKITYFLYVLINIVDMAYDFTLLIPRWPLGRTCLISFISVPVITILLPLRIRLLKTLNSSLRL